MPKPVAYSISVFSMVGDLEDTQRVALDQLSELWLQSCKELLERHGASFDQMLEGKLAHLGVRFTSVSGSGLLTIRAHDRTAVSGVLLSGLSPEGDQSTRRMFVESLRGTKTVESLTTSEEPFEAAYKLDLRPAMILVPWADPNVSDGDHRLASELAWHLGGAFFTLKLANVPVMRSVD